MNVVEMHALANSLLCRGWSPLAGVLSRVDYMCVFCTDLPSAYVIGYSTYNIMCARQRFLWPSLVSLHSGHSAALE